MTKESFPIAIPEETFTELQPETLDSDARRWTFCFAGRA